MPEDARVDVFTVTRRLGATRHDAEGAFAVRAPLGPEEEHPVAVHAQRARELEQMRDEHHANSTVDHRADHVTTDLGTLALVRRRERLVAQQQRSRPDPVDDRAHAVQLLVEPAVGHGDVLPPAEVAVD
ncbi:MAG TPA: hypothetical protein VHO27_11550 [Angustibacter sp.]|nr:hypothetical protein [Angustibacter sp.]